MDMAAIDLAPPTIADLDLSVAGRCSITDHEVIGKTVLHPSHASMVIVEDARVALACPAIVDHNKFPAVTHDRRTTNLFNDRSR